MGLVLSFILLFFVGDLALADSPVPIRELRPIEREFVDAAKEPIDAVREASLRIVLEKALFGTDEQAKSDVLKLLFSSVAWLDLTPYQDVLLRFSDRDSGNRGRELIGAGSFERAPRTERLLLFREAIERGLAHWGRNMSVGREAAMQMATLEGMHELRALIEIKYGVTDVDFQRRFPIEVARETMNLCEGGESRESALRQALGKLAALPDEALQRRVREEEAFRAALLRISFAACRRNPINGRAGEACGEMRKLQERQREAVRRARTRLATGGQPNGFTDRELELWVERLIVSLAPAQ